MARTVTCSNCGDENAAERASCASCGVRLEPSGMSPSSEPAPQAPLARSLRAGPSGRPVETRPKGPMAHRGRRGGSPYQLASIILLVAIILVGAFLLIRLTTARGGASPSPTRAAVTRLLGG
jgi:hypothetical protein